MMNRRGPRTEPWGTPEERGGWIGNECFKLDELSMARERLEDLNQAGGVSDTPVEASLIIIITWTCIAPFKEPKDIPTFRSHNHVQQLCFTSVKFEKVGCHPCFYFMQAVDKRLLEEHPQG